MVSSGHHDLVAEPDVLVCVYDATGSQFTLFFTNVGCTGTNTRASTLVDVGILLEVPTRAHSLLLLQAVFVVVSVAVVIAELVGDVIVGCEHVSFSLFESGSHVVRVVLGPVVHRGSSRKQLREVDGHHSL